MIDKTEDEKKRGAAAQRPVIRYLDRPDCLETFADTITAGIRRHPYGRREAEYAGQRPTLPGLLPGAAAARRNRDQPHAAVSAALTKAGVVKATPSGSSQANGESEGGQSVQSPLKST